MWLLHRETSLFFCDVLLIAKTLWCCSTRGICLTSWIARGYFEAKETNRVCDIKHMRKLLEDLGLAGCTYIVPYLKRPLCITLMAVNAAFINCPHSIFKSHLCRRGGQGTFRKNLRLPVSFLAGTARTSYSSWFCGQQATSPNEKLELRMSEHPPGKAGFQLP